MKKLLLITMLTCLIGTFTACGNENLQTAGKTESSATSEEFVTEDDVLYFSDCSDIVIENITFGHTIEQGSMWLVLYLEDEELWFY